MFEAIEYTRNEEGLFFKNSSIRYFWSFKINKLKHYIEFYDWALGHRIVSIDGREIYNHRNITILSFYYEIKVDNKIIILKQEKANSGYELYFEDFSFSYYLNSVYNKDNERIKEKKVEIFPKKEKKVEIFPKKEKIISVEKKEIIDNKNVEQSDDPFALKKNFDWVNMKNNFQNKNEKKIDLNPFDDYEDSNTNNYHFNKEKIYDFDNFKENNKQNLIIGKDDFNMNNKAFEEINKEDEFKDFDKQLKLNKNLINNINKKSVFENAEAIIDITRNTGKKLNKIKNKAVKYLDKFDTMVNKRLKKNQGSLNQKEDTQSYKQNLEVNNLWGTSEKLDLNFNFEENQKTDISSYFNKGEPQEFDFKKIEKKNITNKDNVEDDIFENPNFLNYEKKSPFD